MIGGGLPPGLLVFRRISVVKTHRVMKGGK
jgi:hypothetical protein